jgi:hypothetical protein
MILLPRHQAGLRDDIRKDRRSIAVTELTRTHGPASLHLPTARGIDLVRISGEVESIFKELCRGLNARDSTHATQERLVNVLCDVWQAHFGSTVLQQVRSIPRITFCKDIDSFSILQENDPSHSRKDNVGS